MELSTQNIRILLTVSCLVVMRSGSPELVRASNDVPKSPTIVVSLKLDKPLPDHASIRVDLAPEGLQEVIPFFGQKPDDNDRRAFTITQSLPPNSIPGTWKIKTVSLILAGSTQAQPLKHNDPIVIVEGQGPIVPENATVTLKVQ